MKRYSIEIDDNGKVTRKCENFTGFELLGILYHATKEIELQISDSIPIERKVIITEITKQEQITKNKKS